MTITNETKVNCEKTHNPNYWKRFQAEFKYTNRSGSFTEFFFAADEDDAYRKIQEFLCGNNVTLHVWRKA